MPVLYTGRDVLAVSVKNAPFEFITEEEIAIRKGSIPKGVSRAERDLQNLIGGSESRGSKMSTKTPEERSRYLKSVPTSQCAMRKDEKKSPYLKHLALEDVSTSRIATP